MSVSYNVSRTVIYMTPALLYSLAFFLVAFGLGAGYTAGTPTALAFLPFFIIPLIYFLPFFADMNRPVFGSRFNVTRLAESSPTNF